jgi:heptose-I-phosphate ethanolaminephosphotransferase
MIQNNSSVNSFISILFVCFYPAFLTFLMPFFYNQIYFKTDIIENFLLASLFLVTFYLFKNKVYVLLGLFTLYLFGFIETMYLVLFRSYFTSSSLFIFFESNTSEISSFSKQYSSIIFYVVVLSLSLIYLLFAFFFLKNKIVFTNLLFFKKSQPIFLKLFVLLGILTLLFSPLKKSFFPRVVAKGFVDYYHEIAAFSKVKFEKESNSFNDVLIKKDTLSETYVLVIGESTSRQNMGIYNYYRETTPLLNSITNELFVYKNVIAPNTHTLTSLEKVLTLGNTENLNSKFQGNILQLFNQAGFSTYWISNQRPTGIWDNFISGISNSAQKNMFFNISSEKTAYDEVVMDSFKTVLKETSKKKLIVLHLMGTHMVYKDRYPDMFEKFSDKPISKFKSEAAIEQINTYDNAVLYQDFVWFNIIEAVKKVNDKAAILFISDHGEEVYNTIEFSGHTETKGTKPMYDIPFVLWLSKKKKEEQTNLVFDVNRKYSTENLIFTMADLAVLKFNKFEPTKSILNREYKFSKRIIFNNQSYDNFFKE